MRKNEINSLKEQYAAEADRLTAFYESLNAYRRKEAVPYQVYTQFLKAHHLAVPLDQTPHQDWQTASIQYNRPWWKKLFSWIRSWFVSEPKKRLSVSAEFNIKPRAKTKEDISNRIDACRAQAHLLDGFQREMTESVAVLSDYEAYVERCGHAKPSDSHFYKEWAKASPFPERDCKEEDILDLDYDPNACLTVRTLFSGEPIPVANYYRAQVYNRSELTENGLRYWHEPGQVRPVQLAADYPECPKGYADHPGQYTMALQPNSWRALPGLRDATLLSLQCEHEVEIGFSDTTQMYYLRLVGATSPQRVDVHYTLRSTTKPIREAYNEQGYRKTACDRAVAAWIQSGDFTDHDRVAQLIGLYTESALTEALVHYFSDFTAEPGFASSNQEGSGREQFLTMLREQNGVCSARSAGMAFCAHVLGISCQMVYNDLHAFVEVEQDGVCSAICLGGGECQTKQDNVDISQLLEKIVLPRERGDLPRERGDSPPGYSDEPPKFTEATISVARLEEHDVGYYGSAHYPDQALMKWISQFSEQQRAQMIRSMDGLPNGAWVRQARATFFKQSPVLTSQAAEDPDLPLERVFTAQSDSAGSLTKHH